MMSLEREIERERLELIVMSMWIQQNFRATNKNYKKRETNSATHKMADSQQMKKSKLLHFTKLFQRRQHVLSAHPHKTERQTNMNPIRTITILYLLLLSVTAKEDKNNKYKSTTTSSSFRGTAEDTTATDTTPIQTDQGAILVIGDSWASASGNYLGNVCGSSSTPRPIQNDAKAGSSAKGWAYNRLGVASIEKSKYEYSHVWLSVGGNDFLNYKCDLSIADKIAANVVNVIKQVVDASHGEAAVGEVAFQEDLKILYFGYAIPSRDVCGSGQTANLFERQREIVFEAIHESDYAEYVTTVDISEMFVTSESSPLSDPSYFADAIHINERGYARLFSGYNVMRFFDCSVTQIAQLATVDGGLPIGMLAGSAIAMVSVILITRYHLKNRR